MFWLPISRLNWAIDSPITDDGIRTHTLEYSIPDRPYYSPVINTLIVYHTLIHNTIYLNTKFL